MNRRTLALFELPFAMLALATVAPLWAVAHPAIEDLPQHLAAIRAFVDFDDPALRFRDYFVIELGRTQYLAYYLVTALLAKLTGVDLANKLVLSSAIIGTPYSMRLLLRSLERDERAAVLVMPLTWNAHLVLGFFNFIAAIPLVLVGLALSIRLRESWNPRLAVGLALLTVVTFYTHVVPFGFLGLGAAMILVGEGWRETLRRWTALVPAGLAMLAWALRSPAGQATVTAARGSAEVAGPQPNFITAAESLNQIPMWLTDVLHVPRDEQLLACFGILLLWALTLGADAALPRPAVARGRMVLSLLAPLAAALYFVTPDSYDWIWPIKARFPLLALVFTIGCLRLPDRLDGVLVPMLAGLLTIVSVREVRTAFVECEATELVGMDRAIAAIPPGERVVGLVYERFSRHVKFAPYLHAVAWYQAERGGAVMFTFADFPQSPIRFREDARPPRVGPRWEWMPERVDPRGQLEWYSYALVRGGPGPIGAMPDVWQRVGDFDRWHVFRRVAAPAPAP